MKKYIAILLALIPWHVALAIGNLTYSPAESWQPIGMIKSKLGHGNPVFFNNHMLLITSEDGGGSSSNGAIEFWNLDNPRSPVLVSRFDSHQTRQLREAHGSALFQLGNRTLLAAQSISGLQVWDISQAPQFISLVSDIKLPEISEGDYTGNWWVAAQAPYLFAAGTTKGLFIVNIDDILAGAKATVKQVLPQDLGGVQPAQVFPLGNLLVATEHEGRDMVTLDISNPSSPRIIDKLRFRQSSYSHTFNGHFFISSGKNGNAYIYDISDEGMINYRTVIRTDLGRGGYGSFQDQYFFSGFSENAGRFDLNDFTLSGQGSSLLEHRDEDFGYVLGNLVFAGDDHGIGTALLPHQLEPDLNPPSLVRMNPKPNSKDIPTTTRLGFAFSDNIKMESVNSETITITNDQTGEIIAGTFSLQMGIVNFTPRLELKANATFQVKISGVSDLMGNQISEQNALKFSTGSAGPIGEAKTKTNRIYSRKKFTQGERYYSDRRFTVRSHPDYLAGLTYLQAANDDKNRAESDFLSFDLRQDSRIYVLFDNRSETIPPWLESFQATGDLVRTSDVALRVYQKDFLKGQIKLGGNQPSGASSQYLVLIEPRHLKGELLPHDSYVPIGEDIEFRLAKVKGIGPLKFEWDFGNGYVQTTDAPFVFYQYPTPGRFNLSVKMHNGSSSKLLNSFVIIHEPVLISKSRSSSTILLTKEGDTFVVNPDNDSITKINQQLDILWEKPACKYPQSLTMVDQMIWITCYEEDKLVVIDSETGGQVRSLLLPYGSYPHSILYDNHRIYLSLEGTGELFVIHPTTDQILKKVPLTPHIKGLAIDHLNNQIFVSRFKSNLEVGEIYSVNLADFSTTSIQLQYDPGVIDLPDPDTEDQGRGIPNYVGPAALAPSGQYLLVPAKKDNTRRGRYREGRDLTFESRTRAIVSTIDLLSKKQLDILPKRIDINDRALPTAIDFNTYGDIFFVSLMASNKVEIFDSFTRTSIDSINTSSGPLSLVYDRARDYLFVHSFLARQLQVFDLSQFYQDQKFSLLKSVSLVAQEKLSANVLRGKQTFYFAGSPKMSRDGYISCGTCHFEGDDDGQIWDFTQAGEGLRNTISLKGKQGLGHGLLHWTANFDEVQDFENDIRFGFGGKGFLLDEDFDQVQAPLGPPKAGLSRMNSDGRLDDLADYVSSLSTPIRSPFFTQRHSDQIDRGSKVFDSYQCGQCHSDTGYQDGLRHDVGTNFAGSGLGQGTSLDGIGFDTPTLRGLWSTSPYFHGGQVKTLEDVLDFPHFSEGISEQDKSDLLLFLRAL